MQVVALSSTVVPVLLPLEASFAKNARHSSVPTVSRKETFVAVKLARTTTVVVRTVGATWRNVVPAAVKSVGVALERPTSSGIANVVSTTLPSTAQTAKTNMPVETTKQVAVLGYDGDMIVSVLMRRQLYDEC